ncbi:FAD-dependent oxidoreductase [Bradyrhizobium canariense]|uniref:Anthranilate 1,2-dioxygenase large subunit n=1 Tax=Bradyrhizobium canariense TaxID=255045 RepID=A0A1H1SSW9_9BRAD|nr:FAD-dependent oxidoreductase [Bradyrhizobium canariense]SDS51082.1 anthranilate 1,2-dioxygenase large subunit [Bradyrhizobium canariense]
MTWHAAISLELLRPDGVTGVEIEGVPVALYKLGEQVYATHGICTHALAFLADGFVEDGKIECPLHQGLFDIRSGKALCTPLTEDIKTYAVKVEDGTVFVDLDSSAAQTTLAADGVALPGTTAATAGGVATDARAGERFIIVGAGQAAAAAIRAMRLAGFEGAIDLVGAERHLPYERPPLSKSVLLGQAGADDCACLRFADLDVLRVTAHLGRRVSTIDARARIATLDDGRMLTYSALLIATGGQPRRLTIPGADLPGVMYLRTLEDAAAIGDVIRKAKTVAIIGGGFIGMELASVAAQLGLSAIVLEREPELMARVMPAPLGRAFRRLAEKHGVIVRTSTSVDAIERIDGKLVIKTPGEPVAADIALVGIGLEPDTALAAACGCDVLGGIVVDAEGRTNVPGIWAAGDCALHHAEINGRRGRLESWHNAEQRGAAAGRSMAGAPADTEAAVQPWFWTDQFGLNVQILGVAASHHSVARTGEDGAAGTVYRTFDLASGKLTSVVAFSSPQAIRAARTELESVAPFDPAAAAAVVLDQEDKGDSMNAHAKLLEPVSSEDRAKTYVWPVEGLTRIPDWVYTDEFIYQREVERIFHGRSWNFVALEDEVRNPGDFIRSHVGPTPVVVSRAEDGTIHVFENRCLHRAAEFCRELHGNAKEFVCPYHQWSYDLKGNLAGVPFRRGVNGAGGMPPDFKTSEHGLKRLTVTTHRGVVFASYCNDMEPLADYLGPEILAEFEATFDGRIPRVLGHYRHSLPGNWKLYHENLKDPYHATLLHTFLVTFGLLVAGNKSLMLADATGRHGVMASAKSDASKIAADTKKEMRAYKEGMSLSDPRFMNFIDEFNSPWSVTMMTLWPNLIIQREMNTLGIRQIVPTGPNEFIMKWTMFGFEGDDEEMTRHRLRQGNLMGPAGFLGLEDNEAIKFVQDGMISVPNGEHMVELEPGNNGTSDTLISEAAIRGMYRYWREVMAL